MTATITDPQATARELLGLIGIEVPTTHTVVLTDCDDAGPHDGVYAVNPSQLDYAVDQYTQATGESLCAAALLAALPWL